MSVLKAGGSLYEEERKMCERFEDYVEKIRKRKLRFTQEANLDKVYDPETKEKVSVPTYFSMCMSRYDQQKIYETQCRTTLETEFSLKTEGVDPSPTVVPLLMNRLDDAEKLRFAIARNALIIVDAALAKPTPRIEEGEAYFAELEECENEKKGLTDERNQLDAELQKLSAEILGQRGQHDECRRQLEECERQRHIHPFRDKPP
jgi:hypothetical protein